MASAAEQLVSNINLSAFSKATELKSRLWAMRPTRPVIDIGAFKELTGTSRKNAIPLLEHLDALRSASLADLEAVPMQSVFNVQLADAKPLPLAELNMLEDRLFPGAGVAPGIGVPPDNAAVREACFQEKPTNITCVSSIGTQARAITRSTKSPCGMKVQNGKAKCAKRQYVRSSSAGRNAQYIVPQSVFVT